MLVARLLVAFSQGVGVTPSQFAQAWELDAEASALGTATVDTTSGELYLLDVLNLVVIPLAVNMASTGILALVRRIVGRARSETHDELEIIDAQGSDGERIFVVRLKSGRP